MKDTDTSKRIFKVHTYGRDLFLYLRRAPYAEGKCPAIQVLEGTGDMQGQQFAVLSVNLPHDAFLLKGEGEFFLKDWSENAGLVVQMINQGLLVRDEERFVPSGHVKVHVAWLTMEGESYVHQV